MGYNTTVIVMNDGLSAIESDPEFTKRLAKAIREIHHLQHELGSRGIDVEAMGHVNAATVIETHHADQMQPVLIGGNTAHVIGDTYIRWSSDHMEEDLLRALATKHGYDLHKKPKTSRRKKR